MATLDLWQEMEVSFIVRTVRETGSITYHCATPLYALRKAQEFKQADYCDIDITDSDNTAFTEQTLAILVESCSQHATGC